MSESLWHRVAVRAAIYGAYVTARVIFSSARRVGARVNPIPAETKLLIGATKAGWQLIELEELFASANEFLGRDRVGQMIIEDRNNLVAELARQLKDTGPSHFYYDPRAGHESSWGGLIQAFFVGAVLAWHQVTPICMLTDFPIWRWQMQVAIVSAASGVVGTIDSRAKTRIFPHSRIVGPLPMAISIATADSLDRRLSRRKTIRGKAPYVAFIGSTYPDRANIIDQLFQNLNDRGIRTKNIARTLGGPRIANQEYWNQLQDADIVVTTSAIMSARGTLRLDPPNHLVFRFLETAAASTCLVAEFTPAASNYFQHGRDYAAFTNVAEAERIIVALLGNRTLREEIATRGHAVARSLIDAHFFWRALDFGLGAKSLR